VKRVPVLSKTTDLTFEISSKTLFFKTKIPFLIAIFKVIATTEGIASPRAQGQETTKTVIARSNG
jgi:hypothetical protein